MTPADPDVAARGCAELLARYWPGQPCPLSEWAREFWGLEPDDAARLIAAAGRLSEPPSGIRLAGIARALWRDASARGLAAARGALRGAA